MALNDKAYNRIVLRHETRIMETGKFEAAVSPGMILEPSASDASIFKPHSTQGGNVGPVQVAEINYLLGKEVTDDYAEGDRGPVCLLRAGDIFVCILADENKYGIGDYLMSAGNGKLMKYTEAGDSSGGGENIPNRIVARLREARDLDSSSNADDSKYAKVEVV